MNKYVSPLRYPGGKSKMFGKSLIKFFPKNFINYCEPFLGGGSMFFRVASKNKEFCNYSLNDADYRVANFWDSCSYKGKEMLEVVNKYFAKKEEVDGKQMYVYIKSILDEYPPEYCGNNLSWCLPNIGGIYFILNRISFSGNVFSGGYSEDSFHNRFTHSSIKKLERAIDLFESIDNVSITSTDYMEAIYDFVKDDSVDNSAKFIYLDPPYYSNKKSNLYYQHRTFDHVQLRDLLAELRKDTQEVKWMLTIDSCEEMLDLYSNFFIHNNEAFYGMTNVSSNKCDIGKELIITNYDIYNSDSVE